MFEFDNTVKEGALVLVMWLKSLGTLGNRHVLFLLSYKAVSNC
jgi:hypothetical protein